MFSSMVTKRTKFFLATAVLLVLTLAAAILSIPNNSASAEEVSQKSEKRVLNVSGQGTVKAAPDIAYVTLGVVTESESAQAAQQLNAQTMDSVISAIKAKGIADTDIRTVNYNISPKYTYIKETGENRINGYTVNNSVQVTVRDISQVGTIIDAAAQNGVNQSTSIRFGLNDYEKYYNEALKNAVEAAKKHAQTIAESLGINLSVPTSISENGGYSYPVTYEYNLGGYVKAADALSNSVSTPISSGTLEVRANVNMTYEY